MPRFDLLSLMSAAEDAPPAQSVEVLAALLAREVSAHHVRLLLTNLGGSMLVPVSKVETGEAWSAVGGHGESVRLSGSEYERAMFSQRTVVDALGDVGWRALVPVTERGDALGILELVLPVPPDRETLEFLSGVAHTFAYCLVAARRHTDLFELTQRQLAFSVPAEIQRRLLPPAYTVEVGEFCLAGWLEPAHNVGGDTFDYSVDRDYLYVTITDAMGHSTSAALLATLTVGSLRNTRRGGGDVAAQADAANAELLAYSDGDEFVTGLILRIALRDGRMEIVNAGHLAPYLIRKGILEKVNLEVGLPLGIASDAYNPQTIQLQPDDRLVLVTDGYLEDKGMDVDIPAILISTSGRHPRQVVQELSGRILGAAARGFRDDATVVCVDWHGPQELRPATAGASHDHTTLSDSEGSPPVGAG